MNINTGAKFHLFPRFLPNDFYFFELFSKIRTYYPQADHLWFGLNIPDGHLEMEDIMKNKTNNVTSHIGKKLLVLGIITVYLCMATACGTNKNNNNNSGSMAASPSPSTSPAAQGSTEAQTTETGTAATDSTMGDMNGNGNTVGENDSMLDNAGNAIGEAGDTVGNIVDDAANGVSDITNDLVGNGNDTAGNNNSTTATTGAGQR
jgi:hypothetical protein